jgi:hypothetical protein
MPANPYRGYRFPKEIISQCVWLHFNFSLSLRDVELMMAFRGVLLTYEIIRNWCDKFGPSYASQLKRRRPKLGDKWFLDEVFLKMNGVQYYLLARGRSARSRDRYSRPAKTGSAGRPAVLPETVAHDETETSRDHYGQTSQLWSREKNSSAARDSSAKPLLK